ncbi:MAG: outer membrane protein [Thiomicrorhabdus sp.]|nr:MAG: outer membrane protein [Thiomicrorhabdus sp.]
MTRLKFSTLFSMSAHMLASKKALIQSATLSSLMAFSTIVSAAPALGLLDIYQMASLQDATLAQARAQHQSDLQGLTTARAELLPSIKADASYNVTDSSLDISDVTTRDVSLTLNQSIYRHEVWVGYQQVEQALETSLYTLKTAEQELILRTTEHYFAVLLAQKTLMLFKAKEKSDLSQLERAEASVEVGLASRVDVLQAKSSYDLSKSERINAENSLDISLEKLNRLTGKPIGELKAFPVKVSLPVVNLDIHQLEAQAVKQNLTVKRAMSQLQSAVLEIEVQKGGYWPAINFQAKVSDTIYSDMNAGAAFNDSQRTTMGVTLSLPLFSGGSTTSKVAAARYQQTAAKEGLRNSQEEARLNVRVQARNLQRGESLVAALQEAVNSNDAFVEAAEESYKVGLNSLLEVLSARSNQTVARKNLVEALHNQVLNKLRLESAVGNLTTEDLEAFDRLLQASEWVSLDQETM